MTEVNSFGIDPISCHAFSGTRDKVAISPYNNEVHIYKKEGGKWISDCVLNQHHLKVTSIDWAPTTNRIVTCSADRNAYVWSYVNKSWKPTLVLLRINRAATCVRWSPKENKFAVGSGAKSVSVCYYDPDNEWWISKHIKKPIRSTVTCVEWHPNNVLLGTGSTDYKARIFSAYIPDVDEGDPPASPWGGKIGTMGALIGEFSSGGGGWIHDVSFSPDGNRFAWVSHDSSVSVVDANKGMTLATIKTRYLPYLACVWSSNNYLITAGHDCSPMLYKYDESTGSLAFCEKVDKSKRKETDGFSAMKKFQNMDKHKRELEFNSSGGGDLSLETIHQNTMKEIRILEESKSMAEKISTVGLDGKLVLWELKSSQLISNKN